MKHDVSYPWGCGYYICGRKVGALRGVITKQRKQIEAMRCCGNCDRRNSKKHPGELCTDHVDSRGFRVAATPENMRACGSWRLCK
jgi:hypothetical protein